MGKLDPLIQVSRYYGSNADYVIAGGGNTSLKTKDELYIKASGISLATIDAGGFVKMSREKLAIIGEKDYPVDSVEREEAVKNDLKEAIISPPDLRPSVETSLHNLIGYNYVVHTHPTLVNAVMCSRDAGKVIQDRFGSGALFVEYTDPGYLLFKELQLRIRNYEDIHASPPKIIFLQNHGIFVGADTVEEIRDTYERVMSVIGRDSGPGLPGPGMQDFSTVTSGIVEDYCRINHRVFRAVAGPLTDYFTSSHERYELISVPFTPDIIVYCKSKFLFLEKNLDREQTIQKINAFTERNGYFPRVIVEEGGPLMVTEENERSLATVLEVFMNMVKIAFMSGSFGGPHPMSDDQVAFIDHWEVENYRRKIARS